MTCVRDHGAPRGMEGAVVAEHLSTWKHQQIRCASDYRPFDASVAEPLPRVVAELHLQASSMVEPADDVVSGRTPALVMSLGPVTLAPAVTTDNEHADGNEPILVGFAVVKDPTADIVVVAASDGLDMLQDLALMGGYSRDGSQDLDRQGAVLTPHPSRAGVSSAVECVLLRGALHASRTFIVDRVLHQLPDNVWDAIQTRGPGWMLVTRVDEYVLNPNVAGRHQLVAWHMWARSARPHQPPSFYQCYTRIQGLLEQHGHDEVPSADVMMPTLHEQEANTASQSAPATLFVVEGQRRLPLHAHIIAESDNAPI